MPINEIDFHIVNTKYSRQELFHNKSTYLINSAFFAQVRWPSQICYKTTNYIFSFICTWWRYILQHATDIYLDSFVNFQRATTIVRIDQIRIYNRNRWQFIRITIETHSQNELISDWSCVMLKGKPKIHSNEADRLGPQWLFYKLGVIHLHWQGSHTHFVLYITVTGLIRYGRAGNFYGIANLTRKHPANLLNCKEIGACLFLVILYQCTVFIFGKHSASATWWHKHMQWNLSVTTTPIIKFITSDLFSNLL